MDSTTVDEVRTYWDRRPCNIRHSDKEQGTRLYFDEVEKRKYFVEPHIHGFAEFDIWRGRKVLEIGCGIGTDAVNFARAGAIYAGTELSEKSLTLTKKRFDVYGLDGVFYLGDAEKLTNFLPQAEFDLVYSFGVIHHTPHPELVIENVKQYMSKSSEFRLMLYSKNSWKNAMISAGLDQP